MAWHGRLAVMVMVATATVVGCGGDRGPEPARTVAEPTATDIWAAELLDSRRRLRIGTPFKVTDRAGYDNQPHFLPDGSGLLYTSIGDDGQADIWHYGFERDRRRRVTRTPEGEYSPTPHADGSFTVIRVEMDGRQRLWRFDADGDAAELLLDEVQPVGYQAWFDDGRVGLFLLGEPPVLLVADTATGETEAVLSSVGRALQPVPGRAAISAVHKVSEDEWNIVEVGADGEVTELAPLLRPGEDFAWLPDGQLVMARGARLFVRQPGNDVAEWQEIADLSEHGIEEITRIAASPTGDRIAFVATR